MLKPLFAALPIAFATASASAEEPNTLSLAFPTMASSTENEASAQASDPLPVDLWNLRPVLTLDSTSQRAPSYLLPAVSVPGSAPQLKEEEHVGSYNQPRWTATRRFPTSRVYVIPDGHIEVEYWIRPTFNRDGTTDMRSLYEVEMGLPYHLQIDLYFRTDYNSHDKEMLSGGQFEVRWALADWGVIPGNPTFYMEYLQLEDRPNRIEPKLLLGGEIVPRWHWATNIVWEQEIGRASRGEGEHELEFDSGISYSVIDSCFGIGLESIVNFNNTRENRSGWNTEIYLGPSIQWKPVPAMTVNFVPMAGLTNASGDARLYLNIGWEF
ncbi:MAG TPA: hypothetical protein VHM90_20025 [Phycisphaerae bacterium]|jgi:hypothetical protein|nr:hypothetical protein [Phycisphaerae bacterium]